MARKAFPRGVTGYTRRGVSCFPSIRLTIQCSVEIVSEDRRDGYRCSAGAKTGTIFGIFLL